MIRHDTMMRYVRSKANGSPVKSIHRTRQINQLLMQEIWVKIPKSEKEKLG